MFFIAKPKNSIQKILYSLQVQLILAVTLAILLGDCLPHKAVEIFYTVSSLLKWVLEFLTPFLVMSCIIYTIGTLASEAALLMACLVISILFSNFFATMLGYFSVKIIYPDGANLIAMGQKARIVEPLWKVEMQNLLGNDHALFFGVILGIASAILKSKRMQNYITTLKSKGVKSFLSAASQKAEPYTKGFRTIMLKIFFRTIIPMLPLTVFGFMAKIKYEGSFSMVFADSIKDVMYIFVIAYSYIFLGFFIISGLSLKKMKFYLRNSLMPYVTAASSMSSIVALPFSIKAAEKNTNDPMLVSAIIPATVNIHQVVASCFTPALALVVLLSCGAAMPSMSQYLWFAGAHTIAKLAGAAIPGGAMVIVLPLVSEYLCLFTQEMYSMMVPIYFLVDPLISSGNTLANQGHCIIFSKLFKLSDKKSKNGNDGNAIPD